LLRVNLHPFQQAINEGLEMVMTAHVLYPALDPDLPGTASAKILSGLLRQQLGFQGVIITDDLEMGAVVRHSTIDQAVLNALTAGADVLLVCHKIELAISARDTCLRAIENGTLPQARVEEAARRIAALKAVHHRRQVPAVTQVGARAHARLVEEILRLRA
jgi:beta-N-acetylhexosaminidase